MGEAKIGGGGKSPIVESVPLAPTRDGRDDASRVHPTHAVIAGVCDIDVPGRVHRHAIRIIELGSARRAAIAGIA